MPRYPAPDPAASIQGTEPVMMTRCTREERKGGRGTVSAPPSPPVEPSMELHQTHSLTCKQAARWVREGRRPAWAWLYPPKESSLCLLWSRGSYLSLIRVSRGARPCSPLATPPASFPLWLCGLQLHPRFLQQDPLVLCHLSLCMIPSLCWFPSCVPCSTLKRRHNCVCSHFSCCSVSRQRAPGFLFVIFFF